ncbi:anoctamin-5-like [Manduca sexta]|uniref:anoctamin-5-like n=1 Tax=Manduca sexta TaxID=7130 RepID=UPI00188E8299|nr:anoctamin-5-like [Manduca sexta]
MMNCGIVTCALEVGTLLCVYVVLKVIVLKGIPALFRYKTDYNQCRSKNAKVPCWEREFRLNNVDEQFIMNEFNHLAMQFVLSTFFVISFPLAPLLILIANTLTVRYNSWYLLLGSRRPLLHNSVGMANWRNIIFMLAMLSALVNVLMMVFNTRLAKTTCYEPYGHYYNTPWIAYFCTNVSTSEYTKVAGPPGDAFKAYKGYKPSECLFLGRYGIYRERFTLLNLMWNCETEHFMQYGAIQHVVILLVISIVLAIPMCPKDIAETLAIEKRIISQCFVRHQRRDFH